MEQPIGEWEGPPKRRLLRTTVPPDLSGVREARRLMKQVAGLAALPDDRRFDLEVVASEACAIAMEHTGKKISLAAWLLADRLVVEISGEGPLRPASPLEKSPQVRGLAMSLMTSLADQVQMSGASGELSRVSLTFLLEPPNPRSLEDPRVHGLVLTRKEVRERRQSERRLSWQASHDPLTGLANRTLFLERVENSLSEAIAQDRSITLLLLDVDRFKGVNDSLGHAEGDRLLVTVAARLRNLLRSGDMAARLGGDEFAVLTGDLIRTSDTPRAAERMLARLREPYDLAGTQVPITVSVGIATSDASTTRVPELLRHADLALYAAKSEGRDRWKLFEPSLLEAEQTKRESEWELRRAVEGGEIATYFQPIVSVADGTIVGLEAVARWTHPTQGLLSPASFVEVAESTGLIVPLGQRIMEDTCRSVTKWKALFPEASLLLMVNLSSRQLEDQSSIELLMDTFTNTCHDPKQVVFEIREPLLAQESVGNAETLGALEESGVRFAIGEFGTGFFSLSRLKEHRIDILKLARPFVEGLAGTDQGASLAGAVVGLAKSLGMQVVAEGVETPEQLEALRNLGCDMWQGDLFSPPVAERGVAALLRKRMAPA